VLSVYFFSVATTEQVFLGVALLTSVIQVAAEENPSTTLDAPKLTDSSMVCNSNETENFSKKSSLR